MRRPPESPDPRRLAEVVAAFRGKRLLVLPDLVADEFL